MEVLDRSRAAAMAGTHRLVGFGAGELGLRTQRFLGGHLSYFVDNAAEKWTERWPGGVPVRPVDALRQEDLDALIVVICTESYRQVQEQLNGLLPRVRLMQTPLLRAHATFDRLAACSTALLVSAYGAAGGLYLLDARHGTWRRLAEGSFRGLLQVGEELLVATERGEICAVRSLEPLELEVRYRPADPVQMHGLAWWPRGGRIIAAEARRDRIVLIDAESFREAGAIAISPKCDSGRDDWHHVNDLCVVDDHLLVSVISRSGWWMHGIDDGAIMQHELGGGGGLEPVITDLRFPHSIRVIGDRLCYLESMTGALRRGNRETLMRFPGFVRGLAGDAGCVYVGQSRHRRIEEARDAMDAISMESGVYVAEPATRVFRFVALPELCDVYDLIDLDAVGGARDGHGDGDG